MDFKTFLCKIECAVCSRVCLGHKLCSSKGPNFQNSQLPGAPQIPAADHDADDQAAEAEENALAAEADDNQANPKYGVDERPPWHVCFLLALQHYVSILVASLSIPLLLSSAICLGEDNLGKAELLGTLFVTSGLITLLQVLFGVRLAVVQAGTFAVLSPTLSYLRLPQHTCPTILPDDSNISLYNDSVVLGSAAHKQLWQGRLTEIQGSIMAASVLEVVLGFSGVFGFILQYIGPLSISPTIALLGVSLFRATAEYASTQWWICVMTLVLLVLFSQHLGGVGLPCYKYTPDSGCHRTRANYPLFQMFPVVLGIAVSWLICHLLTLTNVLPPDPGSWGYLARTDRRSDILQQAPWFRVPYPGQWGRPRVSVSLVCGLFSGLLASMVQSVGDYTACASLSGAPAPPTHAISRGIGVEGLGSVLAGAMGTGNGTSSASINVGVVGLTKNGSRVVMYYVAAMMVFCGSLTKFGALFVTIPDPVIGGAFFILFGMIIAVGVSCLQNVNMRQPRNLFVFGFSFFVGLTVSEWLKEHPSSINTGNEVANNVCTVLLTNMFLGGLVGFVLDNTIPGTREDRGLPSKPSQVSSEKDSHHSDPDACAQSCYDLPFGMAAIRRWHWTKYIPVCPTFMKGNPLDPARKQCTGIDNPAHEEVTPGDKASFVLQTDDNASETPSSTSAIEVSVISSVAVRDVNTGSPSVAQDMDRARSIYQYAVSVTRSVQDRSTENNPSAV